MTETSKTILDWGDAIFGQVSAPIALARRAETELAELIEALEAGDTDEAGKEAADVAILLHRLMGCLGKDLQIEVDAKMTINRQRKWRSAGDGTGGHTEKSPQE